MELRRICQHCGKTDRVNTKSVGDRWNVHNTSDFLESDEDDREADWEFWLCDECERKYIQEELNEKQILYSKE